MTDPSLIEPRPETQPDPDAFGPEIIVISYEAVLAPVLGHLDDVDTEAAGDGVFRFSGVDAEGRAVTGVMTPRFTTGEGAKSIEVSWEVDLTG